MKTVIDVLTEELAELRETETRFFHLFPKMLAIVSDDALRNTLLKHQRQISEHLKKLEPALELLGVSPAMSQGRPVSLVIGEVQPLAEEWSSCAADANLISTVMKVEHYLNAGYVNAYVHARLLGLDEVACFLESRIRANSSLFDRRPIFAGSFAEDCPPRSSFVYTDADPGDETVCSVA